MSKPNIPLEIMRIDEPCPADWNAMRGGAAVRFCEGCKKNVYNLSAMPRDEAERVLCENAGSLCARFARDASGTVITLGYRPQKARRWGWPFWTAAGALSAAVAAANTVLLRPKATTGVMMGAIGPPPQTVVAMGAVCLLPEVPPSPPTAASDSGEALLDEQPVPAPDVDPRSPVVPPEPER